MSILPLSHMFINPLRHGIMLTSTYFQDLHDYQEYIPDRIYLDASTLGLDAGERGGSYNIQEV